MGAKQGRVFWSGLEGPECRGSPSGWKGPREPWARGHSRQTRGGSGALCTARAGPTRPQEPWFDACGWPGPPTGASAWGWGAGSPCGFSPRKMAWEGRSVDAEDGSLQGEARPRRGGRRRAGRTGRGQQEARGGGRRTSSRGRALGTGEPQAGSGPRRLPAPPCVPPREQEAPGHGGRHGRCGAERAPPRRHRPGGAAKAAEGGGGCLEGGVPRPAVWGSRSAGPDGSLRWGRPGEGGSGGDTRKMPGSE